MNLRTGGGRVPIWVGGETPWLLIEWPTREVFDGLWSKRTPVENIGKYWEMLCQRKDGGTLSEVGGKFNVTRERIRAIEARFQRLMKEHHERQVSETGRP